MPISSCRNRGGVFRRKSRHLSLPHHPPLSVLLCRPSAKMSKEMFKNVANSPGVGMCGAGHFHCHCLHPCSGCHTLSGTWGPYFLALDPLGLQVALGPSLLSGRTHCFRLHGFIPAAVRGYSHSGPQGTESGCGKWEIDTWVPPSSLWPRVCPTSPVLLLHSLPLSSSPGHAGSSPYLPLLTWAWPFPRRKSESSRHHVSQALTYGPLVMCDSYCGSLSGTVQPKGLLTVSVFLYLRGLFSPDQTQTRKNDM